MTEKNINWVFFFPAGNLQPGTRTGKFRLGKDDLIVNEKGESRISVQDYAMAMIDALENRHIIGKDLQLVIKSIPELIFIIAEFILRILQKEGDHPGLSLSLESMNKILGLLSDSLFGVKDVLSALGSNTLSLLTPLKM
jgi:hypothetical protein